MILYKPLKYDLGYFYNQKDTKTVLEDILWQGDFGTLTAVAMSVKGYPVETEIRNYIAAEITDLNLDLIIDVLSEKYEIDCSVCYTGMKKSDILDRENGFGRNLDHEHGLVKVEMDPWIWYRLQKVFIGFGTEILTPDIITNNKLIKPEERLELEKLEDERKKILALTPLKSDVLHILKLARLGILDQEYESLGRDLFEL